MIKRVHFSRKPKEVTQTNFEQYVKNENEGKAAALKLSFLIKMIQDYHSVREEESIAINLGYDIKNLHDVLWAAIINIRKATGSTDGVKKNIIDKIIRTKSSVSVNDLIDSLLGIDKDTDYESAKNQYDKLVEALEVFEELDRVKILPILKAYIIRRLTNKTYKAILESDEEIALALPESQIHTLYGADLNGDQRIDAEITKKIIDDNREKIDSILNTSNESEASAQPDTPEEDENAESKFTEIIGKGYEDYFIGEGEHILFRELFGASIMHIKTGGRVQIAKVIVSDGVKPTIHVADNDRDKIVFEREGDEHLITFKQPTPYHPFEPSETISVIKGKKGYVIAEGEHKRVYLLTRSGVLGIQDNAKATIDYVQPGARILKRGDLSELAIRNIERSMYFWKKVEIIVDSSDNIIFGADRLKKRVRITFFDNDNEESGRSQASKSSAVARAISLWSDFKKRREYHSDKTGLAPYVSPKKGKDSKNIFTSLVEFIPFNKKSNNTYYVTDVTYSSMFEEYKGKFEGLLGSLFKRFSSHNKKNTGNRKAKKDPKKAKTTSQPPKVSGAPESNNPPTTPALNNVDHQPEEKTKLIDEDCIIKDIKGDEEYKITYKTTYITRLHSKKPLYIPDNATVKILSTTTAPKEIYLGSNSSLHIENVISTNPKTLVIYGDESQVSFGEKVNNNHYKIEDNKS